eukprot:2299097-Amphidinium_carterae.1
MALSHPLDLGATWQPALEGACPARLPRSPEKAVVGTSSYNFRASETWSHTTNSATAQIFDGTSQSLKHPTWQC